MRVVVLLLAACATIPAPVAASASETDHRAAAAYAGQLKRGTKLSRADTEALLARALERAKLINLSYFYWAAIARTPGHPHQPEAVSAVVRLQESRRDDFEAPFTLQKLAEQGVIFTEPEASVVAYLRARLAFRFARFDEAIRLCAQVAPSSTVFDRSELLRAGALIASAKHGEAAPVFERLAAGARERAIRDQATMALARLAYREQRWNDSLRWYSAAAKSDALRTRALLEQAWAHLQLGAWKAALSNASDEAVRRLESPEADLVEALALLSLGRAVEADATILRAQSRIVKPPNPRRESNTRVTNAVALVASFDAELLRVQAIDWKDADVQADFVRLLSDNRMFMRKAAEMYEERELQTSQRDDSANVGRCALLGVEVALARKDLDAAIKRLEVLAAAPPIDGPGATELQLRLVAVKRAKDEVQRGVQLEKAIADVQTSFERLLETQPVSNRLREAERLLESR